jgi:hypothetical protein
MKPTANGLAAVMTSSQHLYEVRPRKDKRGVDLISVPPESFLIGG